VCNPRTGFAGCPHEQSAAARLWAGGLCIDRAPGSGAPLPSSSDCAQSAPDHSAQRAAHSAEDESVCTPASPPASSRPASSRPARYRWLFIRARPPEQQTKPWAALKRCRRPRPHADATQALMRQPRHRHATRSGRYWLKALRSFAVRCGDMGLRPIPPAASSAGAAAPSFVCLFVCSWELGQPPALRPLAARYIRATAHHHQTR